MLTDPQYDKLVIDCADIHEQNVLDIKNEMNPENDPIVGEGTGTGTGLSIPVSELAQTLRGLSSAQLTQFGQDVSTIAVSQNPGGFPGD